MHVFDRDTDPAEVLRAIEAHEHFWLDLPMELFVPDHPVARALGIHPDRIERLRRRHGRSFAMVEDDHAAIVFSGAAREQERIDRVEVVVIAHEGGLITLRDKPLAQLDERRESPHDVDALGVLDALTDSLLAIAEQMEDEAEEAENRILQTRSRLSLAQLTKLRQQVSDLLRVAREQLGMVDRNQDELAEVPTLYGDATRRVRDLEGHLSRVTDAAESTRQTVGEALNLYLSISAENLTRIATVLLPLTVVSGFFGMNFTWMVDHVDSFWAFVVFGIGGMVGSVAGVRLYLRRKGYA
jgi:magnesium transporter